MVLSALLAVAAARPGLVAEAPVVYSAPAATVEVHEPALAKVGAVVKSIPTAVSHQSQSIVHSSAHVVEDIVAPVVKTTYAAPVAPVAPVVAAAPAAIVKSVAASSPLLHTTTYAAAAPLVYASAPLTYTATGLW